MFKKIFWGILSIIMGGVIMALLRTAAIRYVGLGLILLGIGLIAWAVYGRMAKAEKAKAVLEDDDDELVAVPTPSVPVTAPTTGLTEENAAKVEAYAAALLRKQQEEAEAARKAAEAEAARQAAIKKAADDAFAAAVAKAEADREAALAALTAPKP